MLPRSVFGKVRYLHRAYSQQAGKSLVAQFGSYESGEQTGRIFNRVALSILLAANAAAFLSSERISQCDKQPLSGNFVADAVEIVSPAVVNIMVYVDGYLMSGISSGSGFIISDDGLVVTNAHVVSSSTDGKVLVTTMNGKKRTGVVHSLDAASDIALVQLDNDFKGEKYPTVVLGSSRKLRNGEFVVALGSPMQLQNSCSFGIVSATARHARELGFRKSRSEFIQTDAAINQGNSGGPLVNLAGQVIGINSMKVQGADGISFAIPIDTAMQVVQQLRLNKRVIRPYVGLNMVDFVPASATEINNQKSEPKRGWWGQKVEKSPSKNSMKEHLFNTQAEKVLVQSVTKDSPADKCGIQA